MSIGYMTTRNASGSSSSASRSTSKTTSNLWKVRTPSGLSTAHSRQTQQRVVQDALLAKQRATAAAARLKKAQAQPLTGRVFAIRTQTPQPASSRKLFLISSLAPPKTKGKSKHDPRAQDAARLAAHKSQLKAKVAQPVSKSPVRSVIRLNEQGNQSIVLFVHRATYHAAIEKSPRLVTAELRTSLDGHQTNVLRIDKPFYHKALVNGAADQLGAMSLSRVGIEEQVDNCVSALFDIRIDPTLTHTPDLLEPLYIDGEDEPDADYVGDDEPASPHRATITNEFRAWNSEFNTPPPTYQTSLPPAPAVFSTAVRSGRTHEWHRGAERFNPYTRARRIAGA